MTTKQVSLTDQEINHIYHALWGRRDLLMSIAEDPNRAPVDKREFKKYADEVTALINRFSDERRN